MRRTVVLFLAAAPVALGLTAAVRTFEGVASSRAEEGVRVALQYYLDGHAPSSSVVKETVRPGSSGRGLSFFFFSEESASAV